MKPAGQASEVHEQLVALILDDAIIRHHRRQQ